MLNEDLKGAVATLLNSESIKYKNSGIIKQMFMFMWTAQETAACAKSCANYAFHAYLLAMLPV